VQMCNLAFKLLDMNNQEVVEAMKSWIMYGGSAPESGDRLYDLMWLRENTLIRGKNNRFFVYKAISDNMWWGVVLLRPLCGHPPYTEFDSAYFDTDKMQLVFVKGEVSFFADISIL